MRAFVKIIVAAAGCLWALPASAQFFSDPLSVESQLPAQLPSGCMPFNAEEALSLAAAVDLALCNHPETQGAWAAAKSAAADLGVARSAYFPKVNAAASANFTDSDGRGNTGTSLNRFGSYGPELSISYLLYDFGGREANVEAAKQQMLSAGWNYNDTLQSLVFRVIRGYMNVFTARESLEVAVKSEAASKEAFEAAEARLQVGVVTQADTAQAETAYAQSTLTRQKAENAVLSASGEFATLLGLPPQSEVNLVAVDPHSLSAPLGSKVDEYINAALKQRPDLSAIRAREEQAEAELDKAKSLDYPSISMTGSTTGTNYTRGSDISRTQNTIGVRLSIPIFTGFGNTYERMAARGELKQAAAERRRLENDVALDVWNSYHNYQTAQDTYATAQKLLASATASEELAFGRYKQGKGTLLDALDAQAKLAAARGQWVEARYNTLVTRFDLLRALGDETALKKPLEMPVSGVISPPVAPSVEPVTMAPAE